jgi:hypothetical protein
MRNGFCAIILSRAHGQGSGPGRAAAGKEETTVRNKRTLLRRVRRSAPGLGLLVLLPPLLLLAQPESPSAPQKQDSCVACHSDPKFLVTNKKLYDYFQEWQSSVHKQEGVTCKDCHGGNPDASDKDKAHGEAVAESSETSGVNFKNIPDTCGRVKCHAEMLDGYRQSNHFEHLIAEAQQAQGPSCVTCHGSINVGILNVESVEDACARCHNQESDNHPENPQKATLILNRFLSIHRFYRYIAVRAEPEEARDFFQVIDARVHHLSVTWHTFDLPAIEEETKQVLALLKAKRDEIRQRRSQQK